MATKTPISGETWERNLRQAVSILHDRRHFLFTGYMDGDALGTMLALALYLKLLGKTVYLFLPHPPRDNLRFLSEIIRHNQIRVLENREDLLNVQPKVDALVFCDTANSQLIPQFSILSQGFAARQAAVIEIDHHFGTDSAALVPESIHLFRKANACAEIAAELLRALSGTQDNLPDPFAQRNILLSLLTGLITDTAGGKVAPIQDDYRYWAGLLGERLKNGTRHVKTEGDSPDIRIFSSPQEILEHFHTLTREQVCCVQAIEQKIVFENGVGYLNLFDSTLKEVQGPCHVQDEHWFLNVLDYMANAVPEQAGKVGFLFFNGVDVEGNPCIYLKVRRTDHCQNFDLRNLVPFLKDLFGEGAYLGGGGHPNAVSFRFRPMAEATFLEKVNALKEYIEEQVSGPAASVA